MYIKLLISNFFIHSWYMFFLNYWNSVDVVDCLPLQAQICDQRLYELFVCEQ